MCSLMKKLTAFLEQKWAIPKILFTLSRHVWQSRASALGISSLASLLEGFSGLYECSLEHYTKV
jgi:hypothetical protein